VDIAALILWILTAGGGFVLLGTWIAKGGARPAAAGSRFPAPVIFGHFLLAATGLVLWIIYVANDSKGVGWAAFVVLAIVAVLGFSMLALWIPTYRSTRTAAPTRPSPTPHGSVATEQRTVAATAGPAERHFPVPIVIGHGLLAATTLVLVLLTMVGVGGS
jgi:hypothetical protein